MALTGTETLEVLGQNPTGVPAASTLTTTTGAIAALAAAGLDTAPIVITSISTIGNGTITAAALVGGYTFRSGSIAAFTDTTDTAANIIAALPNAIAGVTAFPIAIRNNTNFAQTITGGSGVTVTAGGTVIPALSFAYYLLSVPTASTVTLTQVTVNSNIIVPLSATALSTVGAGTITAAGIASGIVVRSGGQSGTAFTDTTDTAANIIAAIANANIGANFQFTYQNTTNAPATLANGSGVTVSGITTVYANSTATFLVTYTATNTVTMVGYSRGVYPSLGTFLAGGASATRIVTDAQVSPTSQIDFTLKTSGGAFLTKPFVSAITAGTGFTVQFGTADISTYNYSITY